MSRKLCLIYLYIPALCREELQGIIDMEDLTETDLPKILAKWVACMPTGVVGGRHRAEMSFSTSWSLLNSRPVS